MKVGGRKSMALKYESLKSIADREFMKCGSLTYSQLTEALKKEFENDQLPFATEISSVKTGLLSKDECLVVYNPENLDLHILVFYIKNIQGDQVVSVYSGGYASALHIGGGILNAEHMKNKVKSKFKSQKQKEAEETMYNNKAMAACHHALGKFGITMWSR